MGVAIGLLAFAATVSATDGHILHGVGPVNQAMGGAGTGICVDVIGSVAWNPACTIRFTGNRFELAAEWFIPDRSISSTVNQGAFGPGFPAATLSGTTKSDTNSALLPTFVYVRAKEGSKNAFHMGMIGVSGFGVEYEAKPDFSNPILSPQPPNGIGFGRIESNYMLMKIPLGYTRAVTDKLTIGVAVTPSMSALSVSPAPFAPPVVTPDSPFPYYLNANSKATAWGVGAQVGFQYALNPRVSVGAAYHTPVWFKDFKWDSVDRVGGSHKLNFRMDLPAITTMGIGVNATSSTLLAVDVRYIAYESTRGFDKSNFNPDGSVAGFGWKNIWVFGGGIQQRVARGTIVRAGYNFSQNPVQDQLAFINTPAPAIVKQHLSFGLSQYITQKMVLHFTYNKAFENSQGGPWLSPMGPVPGTSVTNRLAENSLAFGISGNF